MPINLDTVVIHLIVNTIIIAPFLWLAGRALVGSSKAKFTDALWIVILGTVIGMIFGAFFQGYIASIILLIIWLALVKHFFDCGWLMALAIAIIAIIIFVAVALILAFIGFALIEWVFPALPIA
ncbi:MAG: hypothetical protein QW840_03395 [Candidatus Bathyarchaeia archaeon]